jgi:hypothetical protein
VGTSIVRKDIKSYVVFHADLVEAYNDEYTARPETTYTEATMSDIFLKHPNGQPFARIHTDALGREWLKDMSNKTYGFYDPRTGFTKKIDGTPVARGNALLILLPR